MTYNSKQCMSYVVVREKNIFMLKNWYVKLENKNISIKTHPSVDWIKQGSKLLQMKITLTTNSNTNNANQRVNSFPIMLKPINHNIRLAYHWCL